MRLVLAAYSTFSMTSKSMTDGLEEAPGADPVVFLLTCKARLSCIASCLAASSRMVQGFGKAWDRDREGGGERN